MITIYPDYVMRKETSSFLLVPAKSFNLTHFFFIYLMKVINALIFIYAVICIVALSIFATYPSSSIVRRLSSKMFTYFKNETSEQVDSLYFLLFSLCSTVIKPHPLILMALFLWL